MERQRSIVEILGGDTESLLDGEEALAVMSDKGYHTDSRYVFLVKFSTNTFLTISSSESKLSTSDIELDQESWSSSSWSESTWTSSSESSWISEEEVEAAALIPAEAGTSLPIQFTSTLILNIHFTQMPRLQVN